MVDLRCLRVQNCAVRPTLLRAGALALAIAFGSFGYVLDFLSALDVHLESAERHQHDSGNHQHGDADDHHDSPDSDCHHDAHCCCTHAPTPGITESMRVGHPPLAVEFCASYPVLTNQLDLKSIFHPPLA